MAAGEGRFPTRTKFVELFLNQVGGKLGKRHYMGVYVLEEKIKRSKERVNIQKLGTNDNAQPNKINDREDDDET